MESYVELSKKQIEWQDFVDNAIFDLLQTLNPTHHELEWNIEMIGEVRDIIRLCFTDRFEDFSEQDFYPYIEE